MKTTRTLLPFIFIVLCCKNANAGLFTTEDGGKVTLFSCMSRFAQISDLLITGMLDVELEEYNAESMNEKNRYNVTYNTVLDTVCIFWAWWL